ncbi:hypothetical protein [Gordonia sp. SMJS1]|uniref:YveK family protein n=1 Tax=Gordonia sp. SMJS1 TaxID=3039400 RepID=UPI002457CAAF|nr:hypothetical protein [Gordonia sp. SMJS1]WGJ86614.1 hypothetical protein QAD21_05520 [Gordonia sp. SMJS1]
MKVLNVIAAKWMLVVAFTLIGLIAVIGYSLLQPQTYVATVRTYIATGTSDMLEAYQGNQAARASIQTFAVLATDPTVAQRAIDRSGVDISLPQFLSEISVSVPPQTVILDVSVQNSNVGRRRAVGHGTRTGTRRHGHRAAGADQRRSGCAAPGGRRPEHPRRRA